MSEQIDPRNSLLNGITGPDLTSIRPKINPLLASNGCEKSGGSTRESSPLPPKPYADILHHIPASQLPPGAANRPRTQTSSHTSSNILLSQPQEMGVKNALLNPNVTTLVTSSPANSITNVHLVGAMKNNIINSTPAAYGNIENLSPITHKPSQGGTVYNFGDSKSMHRVLNPTSSGNLQNTYVSQPLQAVGNDKDSVNDLSLELSAISSSDFTLSSDTSMSNTSVVETKNNNENISNVELNKNYENPPRTTGFQLTPSAFRNPIHLPQPALTKPSNPVGINEESILTFDQKPPANQMNIPKPQPMGPNFNINANLSMINNNKKSPSSTPISASEMSKPLEPTKETNKNDLKNVPVSTFQMPSSTVASDRSTEQPENHNKLNAQFHSTSSLFKFQAIPPSPNPPQSQPSKNPASILENQFTNSQQPPSISPANSMFAPPRTSSNQTSDLFKAPTTAAVGNSNVGFFNNEVSNSLGNQSFSSSNPPSNLGNQFSNSQKPPSISPANSMFAPPKTANQSSDLFKTPNVPVAENQHAGPLENRVPNTQGSQVFGQINNQMARKNENPIASFPSNPPRNPPTSFQSPQFVSSPISQSQPPSAFNTMPSGLNSNAPPNSQTSNAFPPSQSNQVGLVHGQPPMPSMQNVQPQWRTQLKAPPAMGQPGAGQPPRIPPSGQGLPSMGQTGLPPPAFKLSPLGQSGSGSSVMEQSSLPQNISGQPTIPANYPNPLQPPTSMTMPPMKPPVSAAMTAPPSSSASLTHLRRYPTTSANYVNQPQQPPIYNSMPQPQPIMTQPPQFRQSQQPQPPQQQPQQLQQQPLTSSAQWGPGANPMQEPRMYQQPNYGPPSQTTKSMNNLNEQFGSMNVTQTGFNRIWGGESVDLINNRNILPPHPVEAPRIKLAQQDFEAANCHPDIFRCTMTKIPENNALLNKSRLPLGVLIHPFKDLNYLPVIQCTTIVRCRACRTYINPFVYFVDSKRWKCNLCYRVNELPEEFLFDPVSKTYGDPSKRPEIKSSTIEYIAPQEYMLRPPQPSVYLFLLDVSSLAIESGYLRIVCDVLLEELDNMPGDSRTQIGFLCYNSSLHFYSLNEGVSQPHEMTIVDIDDIFLPCPDSLIVNMEERKDLIRDLLAQLSTRFLNSHDNGSALGAALQAALKLMSATGGRVSVFQCTLPTVGPGSLTSREVPSQRSNIEVAHLNPATDFYKRLALDCSAHQVAVDLFILNSQYVDISTISGISKFSAGCIHHWPLFKANRVNQALQFENCLRRYLLRKIGYEAVMRIRCTRGLAIHTFHGNFFVRSTDLLSLPNCNPDSGYGMQVSIEESLSDIQTVCFQAALLYTSSKAERRIRVHTLCLPIASRLTDVLNSADQQCIVGLVAKMAVDRSFQSSLSDARDAFINVVIDVLSAYKMSLNQGSNSSSLLAPASLKLLPLYIVALLKYVAFRTGQNTRLDDRVFAMNEMKTLPLVQLIQAIYPDFYPIHSLSDEGGLPTEDGRIVPQPPRLQLSAEKLTSLGAFLLDCEHEMIIYVGHNINSELLNLLLGFPYFAAIPDECYELPKTGTPENEKLHLFVNHLNEQKPYPATIQIIRDNSPLIKLFTDKLIEDRVETALSYYEFLQHLKTHVK